MSVKIILSWDSRVRGQAGWFAEIQTKDENGWVYSDDSMKIWFPVDLDEFTESQKDEVLAALAEEFPGAEF